jgi:hypothetical protein
VVVVVVVVVVDVAVDVGDRVGDNYARVDVHVVEGGTDVVAGIDVRVIVEVDADVRGTFNTDLIFI